MCLVPVVHGPVRDAVGRETVALSRDGGVREGRAIESPGRGVLASTRGRDMCVG